MDKTKYGQSSLEFVIVVGAMVFFFIVLLAGISEQQGIKAAQERAFLVKDLAIGVQQELVLAAGAREGYERVFTLPQTLINQEYNISLVSGAVYVATADGKHSLALPVPPANGTLVKGDNKIRKQSGGVLVNA